MTGIASALLIVSASGFAEVGERAAASQAPSVQAQTQTQTQFSGDIEINGMESLKDCADLGIEFSSRPGAIHVSFEDPFQHSSDDKLVKKHCLVDFDIYVPENVRFQLSNAELLGYVKTDDSTFAKVATSYRPIGKAGAVATRKFNPRTSRNFYLESPRSASAAPGTTIEGGCGGYSMTLRLRVDLNFSDRFGKASPKALPQQNASELRIYSANLRYRSSRC